MHSIKAPQFLGSFLIGLSFAACSGAESPPTVAQAEAAVTADPVQANADTAGADEGRAGDARGRKGGHGKGKRHGKGKHGGRHFGAMSPACLLERFDANQDGKLELSELPEHKRERFGAADADGDGTLSDAEIRAKGEKKLTEKFQRADANGDGVLTADEAPGKKWRWMSRFDANQDGKLTLDELRTKMQAKMNATECPKRGGLKGKGDGGARRGGTPS